MITYNLSPNCSFYNLEGIFFLKPTLHNGKLPFVFKQQVIGHAKK